MMILLGVVGVLFMTRRSTPTISHEERITANGVGFAQHNATRLANQTVGGRLYETFYNWTTGNASKSNLKLLICGSEEERALIASMSAAEQNPVMGLNSSSARLEVMA